MRWLPVNAVTEIRSAAQSFMNEHMAFAWAASSSALSQDGEARAVQLIGPAGFSPSFLAISAILMAVGVAGILLALLLRLRRRNRDLQHGSDALSGQLREANQDREELSRMQRLSRETLERQSLRLASQAKALNLVYEMTRHLEGGLWSEKAVMTKAVNLLATAFQYPDLTGVRVRIGENTYSSPGFQETPWRIDFPIAFHDEEFGMLDICLREAKPEIDMGPFLNEEVEMSRALAARLGLLVQQMRQEEREAGFQARLLEAQRMGKLGHWEFDLKKSVLRLSDELYRLYGRDPALGPPTLEDIRRYIPREDYKRLELAGAQALKTGGDVEQDATVILADGRRLRARNIITAMKGPDGRVVGLRGITQDVTERFEAEEERQRQRELMANVLESVPTGVFWKDRNGIYMGCNKVFAQAAGLRSPEEVVGKTDYDLPWTPEQADGFRRVDREILESGRPRLNFQETLRDSVGRVAILYTSKVPLRGSDGGIIGVLGVYSDITDLQRVERDRALLEMAIEQAAESVMITDKVGEIQYVNPAFERITGYSRKEALGRKPNILKSGKQDREFYEQLWQCIKSGKPWIGRLTNRRKDGTLFDEEATISPVRDDAGEIAHFVAVKRDVTQENALQAQLRQAQKMEAIGVLAGGIAHDFNNILTGILGFSTMALEDSPPGSEQRECLEEVLRSANRAVSLVARILTFSRRGETYVTPMKLQSIVRESLHLLRGALPATIEIREEIDEDCPPVLCDSTQMHQVVMNLATNAYHAMREKGGVLDVRLRKIHLNGETRTRFADLHPGPHACLTVADTGIGMAPEILDRIFDPYFTTKGKGEGTGLGLATVHGIVSQSRGAIKVESNVGKGTVFNVYFPIFHGDAAMPGDFEDSMEQLAGAERVMLVDDEAPIVDIGRRALARMGYDVRTFTSSGEALEAFREAPDQFDVIVTDMAMPRMSGMELAREVFRIRPGMPIVLCTGFSETAGEDDAKRIGIREFVLKPVIGADLARAIRRALTGVAV